ncbi:hypothetical protein EI28_01880, partial [Methanoculleus sp. MH98A]
MAFWYHLFIRELDRKIFYCIPLINKNILKKMNMIEKPLVKLRVHIAPVGFEIDRVVLPLTDLKADKVWLIVEPKIESSDASYHYNEIKHQLNSSGIISDEMRCNIRDLFVLLNTFREIVEREKGNQIYINVSTGTKIEAIAGTMTSMIFRDDITEITPYYVCPEKYEITPEQGQQFTSGYKGVIQLPNYKIDRPKPRLIKTLKIIREEQPIRKKDLIEQCVNEKLIEIDPGSRHPESAKHSQL